PENMVFQQARTAGTHAQGVLVICDGRALLGGQRTRYLVGQLMQLTALSERRLGVIVQLLCHVLILCHWTAKEKGNRTGQFAITGLDARRSTNQSRFMPRRGKVSGGIKAYSGSREQVQTCLDL